MTEKQANMLKDDLERAQENVKRFRDIKGEERAYGYWYGRMEALLSVDNVLEFTNFKESK